MLNRCYNEKCQEKHPSYIECTVCDEWHNFQVFAKWHEENYINGFHLDKDIRIKGNKTYSPSACSFVSQSDNSKENAKTYEFKNPSGNRVTIHNLHDFCKRNELNDGHMNAVSSGNRRSHKGWRAL